MTAHLFRQARTRQVREGQQGEEQGREGGRGGRRREGCRGFGEVHGGAEDVDEVLGGDGGGGGEEVVGEGEVEEGDDAEERLGGEDGHLVRFSGFRRLVKREKESERSRLRWGADVLPAPPPKCGG